MAAADLLKNPRILVAAVGIAASVFALVYIKFFFGTVGPEYLYSFPTTNLQSLFREVGLDSNKVTIEEVMLAPDRPTSMWDANRVYCVRVKGFSPSGNSPPDTIWRAFSDLDTTHKRLLLLITSRTTIEDMTLLLETLPDSIRQSIVKRVENRNKWIPRYEQLGSSYLFAFRQVPIQPDVMQNFKIWIFNTEESILYYFDY